MGTIDIIILVCLLPSLYFGLKNGLVKQIISFAVIYLGITLSLKFSGSVEPLVQQYLHIEGFWAKFIAFVAIFAAVALVLTILGNIIEKAIKAYLIFVSGQTVDGHNLSWLVRKACKFNSSFNRFISETAMLNRYYVECRYPSDNWETPDRAAIEHHLRVTKDLYEYVCSLIYDDDYDSDDFDDDD